MGYVKLKTPEIYGGDLDEAIRYFRKALDCAVDPGLTKAVRLGLAESYLGKKQREAAVVELEAALEIDPGYEPAATLLSSLRAYRPDARIAAVAVHGNELTRREFVIRGLTFGPGDVLDLDELDANEAAWRASGLFNEVETSVRAIHNDEHVVVDVDLVETPAIAWGFWPVRLKHTNLFGRRHSFGGEFFLDKEWETKAIEKPYLWGFLDYGIAAHPSVGVALDVQAGYRFTPSITRSGDPNGAAWISYYELHTGWIQAGLSYRIGDHVTVGVQDRLSTYRVSVLALGQGDPYSFGDDPAYPDNVLSTYLDLNVSLPRQRPVASLVLRLEQTLGETSLGARHDFSQTRFRFINRWHLAPKARFVLRLEGGTSFGTIPHWQQFAAGGDLGLRGYTVFDHVGTRMALLTAELRIDALTLLNGNLVLEVGPLFDIGDAFTEGEAFSFDITRYPFDYGLALNLYSAPGRTFRVGMHATLNRENDFNFIVSMVSPI